MKTITPDDVALASQTIIEEREKLAEMTGEPFDGVPMNELLGELDKRLDPQASAVVVHFKLTRDDVNVVMNNRFFRSTGQKLLMGAAIIILLLLMAVKYVPAFPAMAYYIGAVVVGGVFVMVYSRKQRAYKKQLSKGSPAIKKLNLGDG